MKKIYVIMIGILCVCLLASCSVDDADGKSTATGPPVDTKAVSESVVTQPAVNPAANSENTVTQSAPAHEAGSEDIAEQPAPLNAMSIGDTVRSARISAANDEDAGTEPVANTTSDGSNYTTNYELPPRILGGVEFSVSKNRGWFFSPKVKLTVENLRSVVSALKSSYGEPQIEEEDMFYLWQSEDSHFEIRIEYYNTPALKRFYFRVSIPTKPSWLPDSADY